MKKFNLTGLCIPDKHYMVDLSGKIDKITSDYIEQGAYFTINRARQFGKTTMLSALQRSLSDRYLVIRISFEAADDLFSSKTAFVKGFLRKTAYMMRYADVKDEIVEEWQKEVDEEFPFETLSSRITDLCQSMDKEVILMIDEVDKSSDNQIFLSFLGMLRSKYLDRQEQRDFTFHNVILAGVYDVKNLKLKIRPEEERKYNSPWNIAADFDVDMSFSVYEIEGMLEEYAADTGVSMDIQGISEKLFFYTNGYPFLVSWLCKWVDERRGREWTCLNIDNAEKELLKSSNTLFDDLIKNIENNEELKELVAGILLEGQKVLCTKSDPAINLGIMFGILAEKEGDACISNVIFETYLYNHMIAENLRRQYRFPYEQNQFIQNGQLDMEKVLQKFQELMKAEHRDENNSFSEKEGRLLFLCFIKPIINGRGNYYVEAETRNNTRMDIVVSYEGQEYIIELKVWHGSDYRQKGVEQLKGYMDARNCRKGYLISFNFNKEKEYIQNKIYLGNGQKEIFEIVV